MWPGGGSEGRECEPSGGHVCAGNPEGARGGGAGVGGEGERGRGVQGDGEREGSLRGVRAEEGVHAAEEREKVVAVVGRMGGVEGGGVTICVPGVGCVVTGVEAQVRGDSGGVKG